MRNCCVFKFRYNIRYKVKQSLCLPEMIGCNIAINSAIVVSLSLNIIIRNIK